MKNNKIAAWIFGIVLALVAIANAPGVSQRINQWLGKQSEPVTAEAEDVGDSAQASAPDAGEPAQADAAPEVEPPQRDAVEPQAEPVPAPPATATDAAEVEAQPEPTPDGDMPEGETTAEVSPDETEAAAGTVTAAPEVIVPKFGLLRVEPDGSTLVAGNAGPNAEIEILARSDTIATAKAESNGDFVAILDEPLEPGDYEIVLRATETDGDVAMSEETAIVSVPKPGREGELLALVERPGEPSRLINTPTVEEPEAVEAPVEEEPAGEMAEAEAPAGEAGMAEVKSPAVDPEMAEVASGEEGEAPAADGTLPKAGLAEDAAGESTESPATETATADVLEQTVPEVVQETAHETADAGEQAVSDQAPSVEKAADSPIRIEAVEIDNDTVFVAGAAKPGAQVRVYANEFLLGDTATSPGGRFLVEVRRDLAVGDYIIRADVIDPATAEVTARAAVPFTRSEGERLSAVADGPASDAATPNAGSHESEAEATAEATMEEPVATPETGGQGAEIAATSDGQPEAGAATEDQPAATQKTVVATDTGPAEQAADAEVSPTEGTEAEVAGQPETGGAMQEKTADEEPASEAVASEETQTPAADAKPMDMAKEPSSSSDEEAPAPMSEVAMEQPETEEVAAAVVAAPSAGLPESPPEVSDDITVTGKLRSTNSSVIIRRGDTLWHISRRLYGKGTRYTTIYLANQDQIEDPDRIWPGQIFELPEKADSEN